MDLSDVSRYIIEGMADESEAWTRQAIEEGKRYFDFLRGPEPYKHHLGGQQQNLYQMVVTRI